MKITRKNIRKNKRKVGLLAQKPNEYLHVDTTYYLISHDQKVCITFVMDNYSKMILGFEVAEKLSFQVVKGAPIQKMIIFDSQLVMSIRYKEGTK